MDRLKEALHIAVNNLASNVVRSILSILGVVIGIAAVITVLSIGAGARAHIMDQILSMGASVYTVSARYDEATQRMGEFEPTDGDRLAALPFVLNASPQMNLYKLARSRSAEGRAIVVGGDASYLTAKKLALLQGRNFSPIEIEERALVCLISESTLATLFPGEDEALGQPVYIEETPWRVVGVYSRGKARRAARGKSAQEIEMIVPVNSLMRNIKDVSIQGFEVQVKSDAGESAKDELVRAMERDDPKRKGLFIIRDQKDFYARSLEIQGGLSMIGVLVAGISLIVGGIGMMNVMLTSVAERTREIGVRRAVGARKKDILFQFLVESCVLSGAGGVLGLLFGAALARGLPIFFKDFFTIAPRMQPSFLVLAVGTGVALGIAFGFYPAVKASKLSPAEALRTE